MLLAAGHQTSRDAYNFYHTSHSVHVEQAFGRLVRRCGIFWSSLRFNLPRVGVIVGAAMRLHNWCIEEGAQLPRGTSTSETELQESFWRWWSNVTALRETISSRQGIRSDLHNSTLRDMFTQQLADIGATRPIYHH
jgi:hypothetical protein